MQAQEIFYGLKQANINWYKRLTTNLLPWSPLGTNNHILITHYSSNTLPTLTLVSWYMWMIWLLQVIVWKTFIVLKPTYTTNFTSRTWVLLNIFLGLMSHNLPRAFSSHKENIPLTFYMNLGNWDPHLLWSQYPITTTYHLMMFSCRIPHPLKC